MDRQGGLNDTELRNMSSNFKRNALGKGVQFSMQRALDGGGMTINEARQVFLFGLL